jgi:GTPase SAR1 family protein
MGIFGSKEVCNEPCLLFFGLSGSGKTTLLKRLSSDLPLTPCSGLLCLLRQTQFAILKPHPGQSMKALQSDHGAKVYSWTIGDGAQCATLKRYYRQAHAIVLVVDSTDKESFDEVQKQLTVLCEEEELKDALVVVLANKQDEEQALAPEKMADLFQLKNLGRPFHIAGVSAATGQGVGSMIETMSSMIGVPESIETPEDSVLTE